jgi:hypothetical protein
MSPMGPPDITCPSCFNKNPAISAYCQFCAAELPRISSPMKGPLPVSKTTSQESIQSSTPTLTVHEWRYPSRWSKVKRYLYLLLGVVALYGGQATWARWKEANRPRVEGSRLGHRFFEYSTYQFLSGYKNVMEIWTSRSDQPDTKLQTLTANETGTFNLRTLSASVLRQTMLLEPTEWILQSQAGIGAAFPLEDPSLAPATFIMNHDGEVLRRDYAATRVTKALPFLAPTWPGGLHHPGDVWDESVAWADLNGDWTIEWKGAVHWTFEKFDRCAKSTCAVLSYEAQLVPQVTHVPSWARGISSPRFEGQALGRALFDMQKSQIYTNDFAYHGALWALIPDLARAPTKTDPDIPKVHEPGSIVLQFKNNIHIGQL